MYETPIRKGECRLFARFPFQFSSPIPKFFIKLTPRWYSHLGQNRVLEDDQIFLHYQERYLEQKGGNPNVAKAFYLPTKADLFVFQLHNWIYQYQAQVFQDKSLNPALSTEKLLDRYHSHTKHCSSCSSALKNLKRIKIGLVIAISFIWSLTMILFLVFPNPSIWLMIVLTLTVPLGVISWLALSNLEKQFYQGQEIPPRNLDSK